VDSGCAKSDCGPDASPTVQTSLYGRDLPFRRDWDAFATAGCPAAPLPRPFKPPWPVRPQRLGRLLVLVHSGTTRAPQKLFPQPTANLVLHPKLGKPSGAGGSISFLMGVSLRQPGGLALSVPVPESEYPDERMAEFPASPAAQRPTPRFKHLDSDDLPAGSSRSTIESACPASGKRMWPAFAGMPSAAMPLPRRRLIGNAHAPGISHGSSPVMQRRSPQISHPHYDPRRVPACA